MVDISEILDFKVVPHSALRSSPIPLVATLILQCQPAIADDLADLKAANESIDNAINAGDANALIEVWQDGAVMIAGAGFPAVTNTATFLPMVKRLLERNTILSTWYKVDYRVIGDTGLVWGVGRLSITSKETNNVETNYSKSCRVFVKSKGKWKLAMLHASPIVLE
jgi:ketosteroid isomerase-like protein